MLTFPEFVDQVNATLRRAAGSATSAIRSTEANSDEVEWANDGNAIRIARQSEAGVSVSAFHAGKRRGALRVMPMDDVGVEDVCALIIEHVAGADPTELHF